MTGRTQSTRSFVDSTPHHSPTQHPRTVYSTIITPTAAGVPPRPGPDKLPVVTPEPRTIRPESALFGGAVRPVSDRGTRRPLPCTVAVRPCSGADRVSRGRSGVTTTRTRWFVCSPGLSLVNTQSVTCQGCGGFSDDAFDGGAGSWKLGK